MQIELSTATGMTQMRLTGRFDYTTRNQFMAKMDEVVGLAPAGAEIRIEVSGLEYIDSSALGMLLMLRDRAKKQDQTIALVNAQGQIRKVLDTAQFDRLFAVV